MTESQITRRIMARLKEFGGVLFKHADRFTAGVPDLSLTVHNRTWWFEVKLIDLPPHATTLPMNPRQFPALQLEFMRQLEGHSTDRAKYLIVIVYGGRVARLWVAEPTTVKAILDTGQGAPFVDQIDKFDEAFIRLERPLKGGS